MQILKYFKISLTLIFFKKIKYSDNIDFILKEENNVSSSPIGFAWAFFFFFALSFFYNIYIYSLFFFTLFLTLFNFSCVFRGFTVYLTTLVVGSLIIPEVPNLTPFWLADIGILIWIYFPPPKKWIHRCLHFWDCYMLYLWMNVTIYRITELLLFSPQIKNPLLYCLLVLNISKACWNIPYYV